MMPLPRVRSGLLRHPLDNEILVYDARADKVHLLDATTACVMELLEQGGWTSEGIVTELSDRLGIAADRDLLTLAVAQLRDAGLLEAQAEQPFLLGDVNRRDLVRKLTIGGVAAALIPTVATLTASRAYAASSNTPQGGSCLNDGQCAAGLVCNFGANFGGTCQPCQPDDNSSAGQCAKNNDCCAGHCDVTSGKCRP